MQVDYAFIAEAADAHDGLFHVVRGGTDIWHIPPEANFPVGIGPLSFVIRLVGEPTEVGSDHKVMAKVVDADGREVASIDPEGAIRLPPHPIDRTRSGAALVHFRMQLQVPHPGTYLFELHHEQGRLCQVPFWVVQQARP